MKRWHRILCKLIEEIRMNDIDFLCCLNFHALRTNDINEKLNLIITQSEWTCQTEDKITNTLKVLSFHSSQPILCNQNR